MSKITYEKLKEELMRIMPQKYKDGIVEHKYYQRPLYKSDLNFDPYKRGGEILPTDYVYRDIKDETVTYKMSKGEKYIPMMLYWIPFHKDYNCLSPFFIYTFFEDLGIQIEDSAVEVDCSDMIYCAIRDLENQGYERVDYRCKRILPLYNGSIILILERLQMLSDVTAATLAEFIFEVYDILLKDYSLEYWTFPDEALSVAYQIYSNAHNRLFDTIKS